MVSFVLVEGSYLQSKYVHGYKIYYIRNVIICLNMKELTLYCLSSNPDSSACFTYFSKSFTFTSDIPPSR